MGYGLFLAKIVGTCGTWDETIGDRLQVKVLPYMEKIDNSSCPIWPSFFKGKTLSGKVNELVWVICDKEFSLGYILGPANYTTYEMDTYGDYSIPEKIHKELDSTSVKIFGETINLINAEISYWSEDCVQFVRRADSTFITFYSNGNIQILSPNTFIIKVGESMFQMGSNGISMTAPDIKLLGDYVGLGKNPVGNVLTTSGKGGSAGSKSADNVRA